MTRALPTLPALEGVSKNFGELQVLKDLSLSLIPGGISCLLGPSGCGKSTLLRVACGLLPAGSGRVLLNAERTAIVFQEPRLLPWLNVAENLDLALTAGNRAARQERTLSVLRLLGLADIRGLFPRELSGGMAQRVGVARALLRKPAYLLLDEPFAALDAITRSSLQIMLKDLILKRQITCLFVTHDLNEALILADWIYVMRQGRITRGFPASEAGIKTEILKELNINQGIIS